MRLINVTLMMGLLELGLGLGHVNGICVTVAGFHVCWSFRLLAAFIRPLILSLSGFIYVSLFLLSCSFSGIRSADLKN